MHRDAQNGEKREHNVFGVWSFSFSCPWSWCECNGLTFISSMTSYTPGRPRKAFPTTLAKSEATMNGVIMYVVPTEHTMMTVMEIRTRATPASMATEQTMVYVETIGSRSTLSTPTSARPKMANARP